MVLRAGSDGAEGFPTTPERGHLNRSVTGADGVTDGAAALPDPRTTGPTAADDGRPAVDDAEAARLAVLARYEPATIAAAPAFEGLVRLAADLCNTPMALISVVDADTQRYLSVFGVDPPPLRRSESFCGHELAAGETLVVPDARRDPRFAAHRVVVGPPAVRFYAGVPLVAPEGYVLGRLSVLSTEPGTLTARQEQQLVTLAAEVMAQLTLHRRTAELAAEVTARRASEAALAAQEQLLQGVLANPDVVTYARDLHGRFLMANDAMHELLAADSGSLRGRHYFDVLPDSLVGEYRDGRRTFDVEEQPSVMHLPVLHPDGRSLVFRVAKFPLRDAAGDVYGMVLNGVDVTEQLAAVEAVRESERRWHALFAGSPVGIGVLDGDGVLQAVNDALCRLFDRPETELLGRRPQDFTDRPTDTDPAEGSAGTAFPAGGSTTAERRLVLPDGRIRWAWVSTAPTPGPADEVWTLAHMQDITAQVATQQAVRDSEANLTAVAEVMQMIQTGGDARQTIVESGRDLAHAAGAGLLEPAADGSALVMSASTRPDLVGTEIALAGASASAQAFLSGLPVLREAEHRQDTLTPTLQRLLRPGSLCALPVRSGDRVTAVLTVNWDDRVDGLGDRRIRAIALLADQAGVALRQVALLGELEQLALTDTLTGLPNRRSWDQTLDALLHGMAADGRPLSVALVDLDHFKRYNDTFGHAAGDAFLRVFAAHADGVLRSADTVARWGGEEFAVALPDCRGRAAAEVLERIRQGVPDGQTCSVGYATWDGTETAAELMARVDGALYAAKGAGRDRIEPAAPRTPPEPAES
ncbi:diguanylate cyclase domain-containing protein [Nakamurella deserti]|uniref:sensor domain-containing diguanylate cyclase n=1 Tax=Nakamurella deserti TaxID=2164074 RepID=UPI000DBE6B3C|nr:diguanylate cyclase [Nakamurella deserti]